MIRSGQKYVYEVTRTTRTRYVVRVVANTAAEACRKADEAFVTAAVIAKPWSEQELERRIEACLKEKVSREDCIG